MFATRAYAKINLHLSIGQRCEDGLHDLQSIFLLVNLFDTLSFEYDQNLCGNSHIQIETDSKNLPQAFAEEIDNLPKEKNIVHKAVQLFKEKTNFEFNGTIKIKKRIPSAAGLGGGSSDAAAALMTLNKIGKTNCPQSAMCNMAKQLGSDVPFFITKNRCAYVWGSGEKIEGVQENTNLCYVLVNPGIASSTKEAFNSLDAYRKKYNLENPFLPDHINKINLIEDMQKDPAVWKYKNDFTDIFLDCKKDMSINYFDILQNIIKSGAIYANISGSGATCFGVFTDKDAARLAAKTLQTKYPFVCVC